MLKGLFQTKDIIVDNKGIQINGAEFRSEISKTKLSPSFISDFLKSPADAILKKVVEPLVRLEEPVYFIRGRFFHSIMENYFKGDNKTVDGLLNSLNDTLNDPENEDYRKLIEDDGEKTWIKEQLKGFIKMDAELGLSNKKLANLYIAGQTRKGVELIVTGKAPNANMPFVGFADVVFEGEGGLHIIDWKTGLSEELLENDIRQQMLLSDFLERLGYKVTRAGLACPNFPDYIYHEVDLFDEAGREKARADMMAVDSEMKACVENNFTFPFRKYKDNHWGSFLIGNGRAKPPVVNQDKLFEIIEIRE